MRNVTFRPSRRAAAEKHHIRIAMEKDLFDQVSRDAKLRGMSSPEFCLQALQFALEHLGPPEDDDNE